MALGVSVRRGPARRWLVTVPAVVMVLTAGCGSASTAVPASQAVPAGNGPPISGPRSSTVPVRTGISTTITALGTVLSSDGFTLYRYSKDHATPPRSTCTGGCTSTWLPVLAAGPPGGTGMDSALLGTVSRPDGKQQLTVDGWPVYRFVRDTAPGEAKGQGSGNGAWVAVGYDGLPIADGAVHPS